MEVEIVVALQVTVQERLPLIPELRVDEHEPVEIFAGSVMGLRKRPLLWP